MQANKCRPLFAALKLVPSAVLARRLLFSALVLSTACIAHRAVADDAPTAVKASPDADHSESDIYKELVDDFGIDEGPVQVEATTAEKLARKQKILDVLIDRLGSTDPGTRLKALLAFEVVATSETAPFLLEYIKRDIGVQPRADIIRQIGKLHYNKALDALKFELDQSKDVLLRDAIIAAFGDIGDDWALPVLTEILYNEREVSTLQELYMALAKINTSRSLQTIEQSKNSLPPGIRLTADISLAEAQGLYDMERVDSDITAGRELELRYKGLRYLFYYPAYRPKKSGKPWLLTCIHDTDLKVKEEVYSYCFQLAKSQFMAVLVPIFDYVHFREYADFNLRGIRSDKILLELIDYLTQKAELETKEIYLVGKRAGGEFVQRFVMAYPERVARAAIAGNRFILPKDVDQMFPLGLGANILAPDLKGLRYRDFIKSDTLLLVEDGGALSDLERGVKRFSVENGLIYRLRWGPQRVDSLTYCMPTIGSYFFPEAINPAPSAQKP